MYAVLSAFGRRCFKSEWRDLFCSLYWCTLTRDQCVLCVPVHLGYIVFQHPSSAQLMYVLTATLHEKPSVSAFILEHRWNSLYDSMHDGALSLLDWLLCGFDECGVFSMLKADSACVGNVRVCGDMVTMLWWKLGWWVGWKVLRRKMTVIDQTVSLFCSNAM